MTTNTTTNFKTTEPPKLRWKRQQQQQPKLNLSMLHTIMGIGVRDKVMTSCPHRLCHTDITEKYRSQLLDTDKFLNINRLMEDEDTMDIEVDYMLYCYDEEGDGMIMEIHETDYITNEIYLSKVFKWCIANDVKFSSICEYITDCIDGYWNDCEENAWERNLPFADIGIYCVIWERVYEWMISGERDDPDTDDNIMRMIGTEKQ